MSVIPTSTGPQNGIPGAAQAGSTLGHGNSASSTLTRGHQGFDIWGPLQRRKYMVVLLCLIGAGLGYFYFLKTPKVYESTTELMISTQAPPSVVDGNFKLDKVSLSKHSSLLASELVLSNAVTSGGFGSLRTFVDVPNPVEALKQGIIEVYAETDETLSVVCRGPVPEDLPLILNQVVEAYKKVIADDSQTFSEQTSELVEKLAAKLSNEKEGAEARWLALRQKLGIRGSDRNGNVANPYSKRLVYLQDQQSEFENQLRDVQDRVHALSVYLKEDETTGMVDPVLAEMAALGAKDYLTLTSKVKEAHDLVFEHK